jgi:hypothetical protein
MANITRSTKASPDPISAQFAPQFGDAQAGEDISAGQPVCLNTDGKLYKFNSATAAVANRVLLAGIAARSAKAGQPLSVLGVGTRFNIADAALVRGRVYFCSATAGEIDDAATAVDAVGAFYALSTSDLVVVNQGKLA